MADQLTPTKRATRHGTNEDDFLEGDIKVKAKKQRKADIEKYCRELSFPNNKEPYFYYGDKGLKVSNTHDQMFL